MGNNKGCGCSVLDNFTSCDEENTTSSDNVEIIMDTPTIQPTDQILIIRQKENETRVYKACLNDMSAETALLIVEKAVQTMGQSYPADGFIRVAFGDARCLGALSPIALQQSLKEAFKVLPTSDLGDGSPWLSGGVLMQGSITQSEQ